MKDIWHDDPAPALRALALQAWATLGTIDLIAICALVWGGIVSVETHDELAPVTFGAILGAVALSCLAVGLAVAIAIGLALLTFGGPA